MASLINGDGYGPVTAQQDADLYAGIFGDDLVVLKVGSRMSASIQSSTVVRVSDGEALVQGRRIHINAGSYDDFEIPTGAQGVTVQYCIGYHLYQDSSSNELCEQFVSVYDESLLTPAVLRDGATESYITMYIVTQDGITLSDIEPVFTIAGNVTPTRVTSLISSPIRPSTIGTSWEYTSLPALANYNFVLVTLYVNNCKRVLIFARYATNSNDQSESDRPNSGVYVRGGVTVEWDNNRIGVMCPNGTESTLPTVYISNIFGLC